jgi:hypothetical protein
MNQRLFVKKKSWRLVITGNNLQKISASLPFSLSVTAGVLG